MTEPNKPRGRPRLTVDVLQGRIDAYCARYDVQPGPNGLPPFPAGRRETKQHRQWIALYTARKRIALRDSASTTTPADADAGQPAPAELRARLRRQAGRCPVCGLKVALPEAVADRNHALHDRCRQLVTLARELDPSALDGLREYLSAYKM
jgi:hypothetical protein